MRGGVDCNSFLAGTTTELNDLSQDSYARRMRRTYYVDGRPWREVLVCSGGLVKPGQPRVKRIYLHSKNRSWKTFLPHYFETYSPWWSAQPQNASTPKTPLAWESIRIFEA